ncbi:heat shock 70 kDa protein-like [Lotus japonicus]|uniref:heat shock 70 kDa protein-like n=1 Tax=Lotus japonicus TaxID=34305 RepID=UPI00258BA2AA|nr:heat shock 70 kDa protein-like [Lotus japonicus]
MVLVAYGILIEVYEGERSRASDNNMLGSFILYGLPPAPRNHPFDVCFSIDEDGILTVSAEEKTTGNWNEITITNDRERLSTEEINRLIQEAKMYQAEDKKFLRQANAMNALDDCVYKMRNTLIKKDTNSKLCSQEKEKISSAIAKATNLLDYHNQLDEVDVLEDYVEELKSRFERIVGKIG